ncbi:sigma-E factor negative regulatory protein [Kangiella spongicola]|uniref:Anti-sigma 24 factor n=1 Tax=Kangiella spongicola TaxID=796379 RepID=A0A318D353_9GAMM|nr:sigma-E factor negative regulatory protein [Kangiella spongicola]PXF63243.1 anti-sigma 24 factor [Kangiella spongicola]
MSDTKRLDKEILSAWVDGRVESDDQQESLEQGSESMAVWSRYQLIGQVMRNEVKPVEMDISSKVSSAIASEETYHSATDEQSPSSNVIPFPNRIWKQAGGFAIAASVAIVALFSVANTQPGVNQSSQQLAATSNTTIQATDGTLEVIASNVDRQELQTMHDMFLKHEALTRQITGMSSLPTVRVVSNQKVIPVQVPMRVEDELKASQQSEQGKADNKTNK